MSKRRKPRYDRRTTAEIGGVQHTARSVKRWKAHLSILRQGTMSSGSLPPYVIRLNLEKP